MSIFIVEKNVPMPNSRTATYKFEELGVDDVMVIKLKDSGKPDVKSLIRSIRNAIHAFKQTPNHNGMLLATRTFETAEDQEACVKVYRIK